MKKYQILSDGQVEQVHETALKVLDEVGVQFHNEESLKILGRAGAKIDGTVARIPAPLVEDALQQTPAKVTLYNRDMTESTVWGDGDLHLGAGGSAILLLDGESRKYRKPETKDLINIFKIIDSHPVIEWSAPGIIVKDVPTGIAGVWRFYLRLKYGAKPSCADGLSAEDLLDNLELLRVIRDDLNFKEKPFSTVESCSTPPLKWTNEGAAFLVEGAKAGLPIVFIPMLFTGAGAPITIAGSVVQHAVESLAGLVLVQSISPGIPTVYSGAPAYMNMRSGNVALSAMEIQMVNVANVQMGKYYNMPTATGDYTGHSDSKLNDFQCGVDSAVSQLLVAIAGIDAPLGVGFLSSQEAYSLEKLVMDCELFKSMKKLAGGINVTDESLAFEVFKEVGTDGNFLNCEHTFKWFRKEFDEPEIFNRESRTDWQKAGEKDTHEYAMTKVKEIISSASLNRLEPEKDKALDKKMDGILKRRGLKLDDFRVLLPEE